MKEIMSSHPCFYIKQALCQYRVHAQPEVIRSLLLAKSASWNNADTSFLQQFEAVEHVGSQRQGLHVHTNRKEMFS